MADRSPRLYSPDSIAAAAKALEVVAAADALTLEQSLDAALMAIAAATATTGDVPIVGIEPHHRCVVAHEESASAARHSMQASAVGGQSLQPLLCQSNLVSGTSGSLTRLRHPPSSPQSPAVTAGIAAEDTAGLIATLSTPAVLETNDKLTAMHRALATVEQLIHTLDVARPACAGAQISQEQGRHLPRCCSTPQDLQQQLSLLHGCRQELQHAIQRSKVLDNISPADCASARQLSSNTNSSWLRAAATGGAPGVQLDVLQHYRSRISSSRSNSNPLLAPRQVHNSQSSHSHQALGFGSLMGQPQAAAAAAAPTVPRPAQNRILQVVSGVREGVNSSFGSPVYAPAQQPSFQNAEQETLTSLNGWLAEQRD